MEPEGLLPHSQEHSSHTHTHNQILRRNPKRSAGLIVACNDEQTSDKLEEQKLERSCEAR